MEELQRIFHLLGLDPFVAIGMILIDFMLFGGEVGSGGLAIPVTSAIAAGLTIPCILIQKYVFKDNWGGAIGKGLLVGLLTGIPTPIPSIGTGIIGVIGLASKILPKHNEENN
jgi:hypothetical protein